MLATATTIQPTTSTLPGRAGRATAVLRPTHAGSRLRGEGPLGGGGWGLGRLGEGPLGEGPLGEGPLGEGPLGGGGGGLGRLGGERYRARVPDDLAGEVTELLRRLIRNACVNDGSAESGHE